MQVQNKSSIIVAILAGGKSSRMGTDKASLVTEGETLLARTARLAQAVSDLPPLIVGRDKPDDWKNLPARFIPDDMPGIGPVGGIRTAIWYAGLRSTLALSCDLPALTESALIWLCEQPRGELGVVARNGEQLEPLFAIYSPMCLKLLITNINAGKRSLHALVHTGGEGFAFADVPSGVASALANVNTPEQWATFHKP
ncbi:MAG: molybdenum cofactor guanylyltransferase [Fibrella sp.]|nr:molybdenum cofactor guanylyltransferase [Armatimonadota bacterium]